jgi:hypothetical protein
MVRAIFPLVGDSFDRFLYLWLHLITGDQIVACLQRILFARIYPSLLSLGRWEARMSDQYDVRPWYALLPLPSLILAAPFAFITFCGSQWQPELSTFKTLAQYKQPPELRVQPFGERVRLAATSWLSWPPKEFAHCDLQPTKHPRLAICFGDNPREVTLARADVDQLVLSGLLGKNSSRGRWLTDGHRYLWGETLIETKPQLRIAPLPAPFHDLELPSAEQPRLLSLSTDQEYALWEDRRARPDGTMQLVVTRIDDGRQESALSIENPSTIAKLRDPKTAPQLIQTIVWWTDQGRRQRVLLHAEELADSEIDEPGETAEPDPQE